MLATQTLQPHSQFADVGIAVKTHNPPSRNKPINPSFFDFAICSFDRTGSGRIKIETSDRMLMMEVYMKNGTL